MSGVKELPASVDRWPEKWRDRFYDLRNALFQAGESPDHAMRKAERKVRAEHFAAGLRRMQRRMGSVPERSMPNTDPNQMTFADRTAPKD